ncbi:hypothetical protein J14TS2_45590 [Bacillus sp. J14TS2]|uniref:hypothetical protein n=1 Tax=Bacillus sp. J14TS2 TaxID=2807188 RepID=UPI001B19A078|nr:hypothetical protein [Bacillus sp. J14TS2]GIN74084.1 hypothetical protein J14TS2_45590 [Bacillus sp. J14TS2]
MNGIGQQKNASVSYVEVQLIKTVLRYVGKKLGQWSNEVQHYLRYHAIETHGLCGRVFLFTLLLLFNKM